MARREAQLGVRMDKESKRLIDETASRLDMTASAFVRSCVNWPLLGELVILSDHHGEKVPAPSEFLPHAVSFTLKFLMNNDKEFPLFFQVAILNKDVIELVKLYDMFLKAKQGRENYYFVRMTPDPNSEADTGWIVRQKPSREPAHDDRDASSSDPK